jgi:glycosyltransferase involved in cell wall biosynthesis
MLRLVELIQAQDYEPFEVLVIEQTEGRREAWRAELERLKADPRVRILEFPPLGVSGARNMALRHARGDVMLFIDDDDVPLRRDWVSCHARNFANVAVVAVTGRQVWSADEDPAPHNTLANRRLCLRYSFLRIPRARTRHSFRLERRSGMTVVHGTNSSYRRSALLAVDGWDDDPYHDEDSFPFRYSRIRRPGDIFVFDPDPAVLRRMDVAGGMARRAETPYQVLRAELMYSHRLIRRYFPVRFYACYPAYLLLSVVRSLRFVREYSQGPIPPALHLLWSIVTGLPPALREVWADARQTRRRPIPGFAA